MQEARFGRETSITELEKQVAKLQRLQQRFVSKDQALIASCGCVLGTESLRGKSLDRKKPCTLHCTAHSLAQRPEPAYQSILFMLSDSNSAISPKL
ncbi:hypothetical protein TWF696_003404 [Orbilia brochopaga]|uniref:Uncharacterized protein n=1 Tax=Orbilia brochopaga TaxID=3140254 RepID=A0AAV9TXW5_9PEZI